MPRRITQLDQVGNVTVVSFNIPHDRVSWSEEGDPQLRDELIEFEAGHTSGDVVVDCSTLPFMSSSMIGVLVTVHRNLRAKSARLSVCCLAANARDVFRVTKLDKLIDILPSRPSVANG